MLDMSLKFMFYLSFTGSTDNLRVEFGTELRGFGTELDEFGTEFSGKA